MSSRVSRWGRGIVLAVVAWISVGTSANCQSLPPEIADFDRPYGFLNPTLATVVRSFTDAHLYNIVPNQLEIKTKEMDVPDVSFLYRRGSLGGYFVVNVEVSISESNLERVSNEIRSQDPAAKFVVIEPIASEFKITVPGAGSTGAIARDVKVLGPRRFAVTFVVDDIVRRIMLLPNSHEFDFFAISYEGKYRGVQRDDAGATRLADRTYSIGSSFGGVCSLHPTIVVDLESGQRGCVYPHYSAELIRAIQASLRKMGIHRTWVDGQFGPRTHESIQIFQRQHGLRPDGIPSEKILETIKSKAGSLAVAAGSILDGQR